MASRLSNRLLIAEDGANLSILSLDWVVQKRSIAARPFGRLNRLLLPALKISLPALNDGAGNERLFVVNSADSQG